ncbi:hypothetical protein AB0M39_36220 [Streptomyces sp. NPDC051907]|uniref:hypothetical protein n=1 Tax=Streptomyces sp. NPDC051907 TaxID=3155284 RepID=UPI00341EFE66
MNRTTRHQHGVAPALALFFAAGALISAFSLSLAGPASPGPGTADTGAGKAVVAQVAPACFGSSCNIPWDW